MCQSAAGQESNSGKKIAVITGGARGIGRAIAQRHADEGARVVIADSRGDEARETASAIGRNAVGVDQSRNQWVRAMAKFVADEVGAADILVSGAAICSMGRLAEISEDQFDRQFNINVRGLVFASQAISGQMVAAGKGGKIMNSSSQAGSGRGASRRLLRHQGRRHQHHAKQGARGCAAG